MSVEDSLYKTLIGLSMRAKMETKFFERRDVDTFAFTIPALVFDIALIATEYLNPSKYRSSVDQNILDIISAAGITTEDLKRWSTDFWLRTQELQTSALYQEDPKLQALMYVILNGLNELMIQRRVTCEIGEEHVELYRPV